LGKVAEMLFMSSNKEQLLNPNKLSFSMLSVLTEIMLLLNSHCSYSFRASSFSSFMKENSDK